MKSSRMIAVLIALQLLTLAGQWSMSGGTPAQAQIPDAGAQRNEVIAQLKQLNEKIAHMSDLLDSGKLQVQSSASDDKKEPARR